jgi:hypothetical protein
MPQPISSRRRFLQHSSGIAAASAFSGMTVPFVHAAENSTVEVALVGCGGRGSGAAAQALSVISLPTKLTAMADVSPAKLNSSYTALQNEFASKPERLDVPEERRRKTNPRGAPKGKTFGPGSCRKANPKQKLAIMFEEEEGPQDVKESKAPADVIPKNSQVIHVLA